MAGPEPTPAFAAEVAEECERLLALLEATEPFLRQVAVWKMEGFTTEEIVEKTGRSRATVERKLVLIRALWGQENK
jgi:hypothetical protein